MTQQPIQRVWPEQRAAYQAILIKWFGPTQTKPSRLKVSTATGSKWYARDLSLSMEKDVRRVVEEYMKEKDWAADAIYIGQLPNGDWCAVQLKED